MAMSTSYPLTHALVKEECPTGYYFHLRCRCCIVVDTILHLTRRVWDIGVRVHRIRKQWSTYQNA
jgi:hypothetical protein